MTFFNFNVLSVNCLECIAIKNQVCKARTTIINTNSNEPVLYTHTALK